MSVVVITRGRRTTVRDVIRAALDDPATTELIAVVDAPSDGRPAVRLLVGVADPRIRVVHLVDRGPAAARQAGVDVASSEVVLLLDDDVVPRPSLVTGHARWHAAEDGIVVLGYMPIVAPSLSPASDLVARLYSLTYERHCLAYERDPQSVLLRLWGGNLSVRRSDCGRVPPHSPLFSHRHHEDQDFGIRCLRAGLQGRFCRALRADHRHSGTLSEFAASARREGAARVRLHELHSDLLGRLAPSAFTIGLPLPARLIARSGRRPVAGRVLSAVLRASTALCGRLRLTPLATVCAQLLRRTEVVRGAWGAGGWPRQPRWKRPARRDESERIENPRSSKPPQSARNP